MKPFQANLLNAFLLISMGTWAIFESEGASNTVYITPAAGLLLLALTPGVKAENKVIAHIAVLLTLLLVLLLAIITFRQSGTALLRVGLQLFGGVLAMVVFIRSFIQARKARI